ncbi:MAG: cobalamin-dependent protein [Verrucomicrobia bacterium]|nr:cobalamin-dependent protein [Verrucomicrobiota bacterium]
MPDIVLTTLNARYSHASFGLRYLMANLGDLREQAVIREFDLQRPLEEVRDEILRESPRIVGIGVYIWNTGKIFALVDLIRRSSPDTVIILGGPEVSFETEQQTICAKADYVLCGEADLLFAQYCRRILDEDLPDLKTVQADPPSLSDLVLPYDLYDEEDVTHRLVYVEASRGCPFHCEYCLSSMDDTVRRFDLDRLFPAFQSLLERGVRQFKFVDRTFNLHIDFCIEILDFFLCGTRPASFCISR